MSITTTTRSTRSTRSTRRLGLASSAAATAALLLLASGCGTEAAVDQAPDSISKAQPRSTEHQSPSDRAECLVGQAKHRGSGVSCAAPTASAEVDQPLFLAPTGRPVPLPGQAG